MEIQYKTNKLSTLCHNLNKAKKIYNENVAQKLLETINFIEAAPTLKDIVNYPPFHFHDLKGTKKGLFAIDLGRKLGYRLIVKPLNPDNSECTNEQVFGKDAIKIIIMFVEEVSNHYE